MNRVKLALPKGRLMSETAALLDQACWGMHDYYEGTRSYRVTCEKFPDLMTKIFHEKDIQYRWLQATTTWAFAAGLG